MIVSKSIALPLKSFQLFMVNSDMVPLEPQICPINISGFSIDNFRTFNPEAYTVLCRLGESCDGLNNFPKTSKIVLNINQTSQMLCNFEQFIPKIAEDFGISREAAIEKSVNFFSDKVIVVQPTGIQGKVYNSMRALQNYTPMAYATEAVSILKTTGMTGFTIISKAPLTFVGVTYLGSIFFGYCGSVAGNNSIGTVCNFTSFVLSRPMRCVEITLNGLILRPISNLVGVPLILKGTQEILAGKGLSLEDFTKIGIAFQRISNSNLVKKTKKIYKIIRNKK